MRLIPCILQRLLPLFINTATVTAFLPAPQQINYVCHHRSRLNGSFFNLVVPCCFFPFFAVPSLLFVLLHSPSSQFINPCLLAANILCALNAGFPRYCLLCIHTCSFWTISYVLMMIISTCCLLWSLTYACSHYRSLSVPPPPILRTCSRSNPYPFPSSSQSSDWCYGCRALPVHLLTRLWFFLLFHLATMCLVCSSNYNNVSLLYTSPASKHLQALL